jgi:hypothetical protein
MYINLPIENVYEQVNYIPAKTTPRFTTVIFIHPGVDAIHLQHFINHNKDTDVYIISDKRDEKYNRLRWKNCDVLLREWWLKTREKIKTNKVLAMEYDVLVTTKITDKMFTDGVRMIDSIGYFKDIPPEDSWNKADWWWGVDGDKLPLELKRSAAGSPVTIMWFDTSALDFLILKKWDSVFSDDIICEIRIPSILNYHHVPLYGWDIHDVFLRNSNVDISQDEEAGRRIKNNLMPGIYHPVRIPVDQLEL